MSINRMGSVPDTRLMNLRDTRLIKSRIPNILLFYFNYTTLSEISEIWIQGSRSTLYTYCLAHLKMLKLKRSFLN